MGFAPLVSVHHRPGHLLQTGLPLRDQHHLRPADHPCDQRQIPAIPSHGLHQERPPDGGGGVPQPVDGVDDGVQGRIHPDAHVRAPDVVVDAGGDADHGEAALVEGQGAAHGAVAADHHQAFDPMLVQAAQSLALPLLRHKLLRAGGLENGPAALDDAAHVPGAELHDLPLDQALEPPSDPQDPHAVIGGGAHHRPDAGVHARRIPSAGHHPNAPHPASPPWRLSSGSLPKSDILLILALPPYIRTKIRPHSGRDRRQPPSAAQGPFL
jgi:hypothetical protein